MQAALCPYVFVHLSKCARPPAQVAGDNHFEWKSNLEGKHRQHESCREPVMTILHGRNIYSTCEQPNAGSTRVGE